MRSKRQVTVASVQMDVVLGDRAATVARMASWADEAATQQADVVLFPELVLSAGYSLGERFHDVAEPIPGPSTAAIGEKARQHGIYIVAGMAERSDTGTVYNTAVIIGRNGEVVGSYRKTHIFPPTEASTT